LANAIFERAAPIVDELLDRPVTLPRSPEIETVEQLNDFSGVWNVDTEVTFLAGLYTTGDNINSPLTVDINNNCVWLGARAILGTEATFTVTQNLDDLSLRVTGDYPGTNFPSLVEREPGPDPVYTGEVTNAQGIEFSHAFTFPEATRFEWVVDVVTPSGGVCGVAQVRGVGTRAVPTPAPIEVPTQAPIRAAVWQAAFGVGAGTVPDGLPLADCPEAATFATPITTGIVNTTELGDGTLQVVGTVTEIPLPATLTPDPLQQGRYLGSAANDTAQYIHEITVTETTLAWRIMLRSQTGNCRIGTISGIGQPLGVPSS
ncbi:MAG: hypothetical protein AAF125_18080, partial [Chloroflexota bacterium]